MQIDFWYKSSFIFNVNLNVQFWFQGLLGFVDILCFYFPPKKHKLNGVLHYQPYCSFIHKKNKLKLVVFFKKRRAQLFQNTMYPLKVDCLLLISKRVFDERLHILVLFYFLFVCLYMATLEPLYFSTTKMGPNIFIVQSYP